MQISLQGTQYLAKSLHIGGLCLQKSISPKDSTNSMWWPCFWCKHSDTLDRPKSFEDTSNEASSTSALSLHNSQASAAGCVLLDLKYALSKGAHKILDVIEKAQEHPDWDEEILKHNPSQYEMPHVLAMQLTKEQM